MIDPYSPTDPSSNTNQFLDSINQELEASFTCAASIAKDLNDEENSQLAAKRAFSYKIDSETVLELFPQYKPIVNEIAQLIDKYRKILIEDSKNVEAWECLGNCYLVYGDFPNALTAYSAATRIIPDPQNPVFSYAIGIVYAHFNYNEYALQYFQKVIEQSPRFSFADDIMFRIAILNRTLMKYDVALRTFEEIKTSPPNGLKPEDIYMQIAYTYQLQGNAETANQLYRELHQRFPDALKPAQQYCLFLFLQYKDVNLEMVKTDVNEALEKFPSDPVLLMIAARIAMKENNMEAAYKNYRYCTTYYSKSPYFWCGLGVLYYKNEQVQDAVIAFQRGLFLKNDMIEAWLNIGLILESLANYQNAIKVYQTGKQKCPNSPDQAVFDERLSFLNSQMVNHRKQSPNYRLIDIDDSKFIPPIPEQFANDYISAVPVLPASCFNVDAEKAEKFAELSTYPKSLFV